MGSPGAGKTSVGRILGHRLRRKVVDVDDDVLETVWGMSVADKVRYDQRKKERLKPASYIPLVQSVPLFL